MIFNGLLITNASGRLGNDVFSRNSGGPYVRALGNPNPNPPTDEQLYCRSAMTKIVEKWRSLSPAQRLAWSQMADNFPVPGRTGVVRSIGGLPAFTRANHPRLCSQLWLGTDLDFVYDPPDPPVVPFERPQDIAAVFPIGDTNFYLSFNTSSVWTLSVLSAMLVYVSPPLDLSVNWYKSPMTLVAAVITPVESPIAITTMLPTPVEIPMDKHYKVKLRTIYADGSVSQDLWLDIAATP